MLCNFYCLGDNIIIEKEVEKASILKRDYYLIINKLKQLYSNIILKTQILDRKLKEWEQDTNVIKEIVKHNGELFVQINVGGKIFMTKLSTLLNVKGSLFEKIILSQFYDKGEEIFFDRSPRMFNYILNFMRYRYLNFSNFTNKELLDLRIEADYYGINKIIDRIDIILEKK
jgi:hypothetical protein